MRKRKHSDSFQRLCKRRGWSCCPSDNAGKKTFFFLGTHPYVWCIRMKYGQNKNAMKSFSISPDLRNKQKSPKSRVAESGFTQFLYSHGILDGTWWILMSRRHQICMPKGGRVCLRPSYRRAWPSFQKRNRQHCGVKTNVSPTIFEMELAHLNHFFP